MFAAAGAHPTPRIQCCGARCGETPGCTIFFPFGLPSKSRPNIEFGGKGWGGAEVGSLWEAKDLRADVRSDGGPDSQREVVAVSHRPGGCTVFVSVYRLSLRLAERMSWGSYAVWSTLEWEVVLGDWKVCEELQ